MVGSLRQQIARLGSWEISSLITRIKHMEVGWGYEISKPASSDVPSISKLHHLPYTVAPAGNQVFKILSLWILNQTMTIHSPILNLKNMYFQHWMPLSWTCGRVQKSVQIFFACGSKWESQPHPFYPNFNLVICKMGINVECAFHNLAPERPGISEDGQIYKPVEAAAFTECCWS